MNRHQNLILLTLVIILVAAPLWLTQNPAPGPDGKMAALFAGADDKAKDTIATIAPQYKPWFKPLMEPPSGEISSLLFALQAALGAGFLGYWLGCSVTRAKTRHKRATPDAD
jgi:cobalt/nickel transport protein